MERIARETSPLPDLPVLEETVFTPYRGRSNSESGTPRSRKKVGTPSARMQLQLLSPTKTTKRRGGQTTSDTDLVVPLGGNNPLLNYANVIVNDAAARTEIEREQQQLDAAANAQAAAQAVAQPVAQPVGQAPPGLSGEEIIRQQGVSNIEKFKTVSVEFSLYTDPELESHRMMIPLPAKDRYRLSRQTISSMRVQTMRLRNPREPEKSELLEMAQALCMRYPGLRDPKKPLPHENWVGLRTFAFISGNWDSYVSLCLPVMYRSLSWQQCISIEA